MREANPDPGALRIERVRKNAVFVNAFAANEPKSSRKIWEAIMGMDLPWKNPILVMNCRPDRVDRTWQFIKDFFPYLPECTLLVIGSSTSDCRKAYARGKFPNVTEFRCFEGGDIAPVMEYLEGVMEGRVIFGVGNIHGAGHAFIEALTAAQKPEKPEEPAAVEDGAREEVAALPGPVAAPDAAMATAGEEAPAVAAEREPFDLAVPEDPDRMEAGWSYPSAWAGYGPDRRRGNILAAEAFALSAQLKAHVLKAQRMLPEGNRARLLAPPDNFRDILAVYAVLTGRTAEYPWGLSLPEKKDAELLRSVYWNMTQVWSMTRVTDPAGGAGAALSIRRLTAAEGADAYGFTAEQKAKALSLARQSDEVDAIVDGSVFARLTEEEFEAALARVPEEAFGERRAVLLAAASLVGKVAYFPGGRSLAWGWDGRWGETRTVASPESGAYGTARPLGLDSAGLVSWAFLNALGPDRFPNPETPAPWRDLVPAALCDARPGDLAFYEEPEDGRGGHMGIVLTVKEEGPETVIHCAENGGVQVSGAERFPYVGRPAAYHEPDGANQAEGTEGDRE